MSQKLLVLQFLKTLPTNKVTTYKALAEKFDTHPRAIANYMRTNKEYELYPCYKVISSDRGLSGYILGVEEKRKRLEADGVLFDGNKIKNTCIILNFDH